MYWVVDGLCMAAGIAGFVLSFYYKKAQYSWGGPVWIIVYPIILEGIYNLISCCLSKKEYAVSLGSRFIYTPGYNISFCGLQKFHPFDSQKYGNIMKILLEKGVITKKDVTQAQKPPRSLLLQKMSPFYLLKLCYSIPLCCYIEMPLFFLPAFLLRWRVLDPMLRATEGTIKAACVADQRGWAVNLSGGYHHASLERGGGFCVYPDITLAVHYIRTRLNKQRIMVVDLDAHQGNGYQRDLINDKNAYVVDFYNHSIYPNDYEAKTAIKKDVNITSRTTDAEYLEKMKTIEQDIDQFKPEFIIYNAGTDILDGDPLGRMQISPKGIVQRDELMIGMCKRKHVPVVMVLSGGYQMVNAEIIAESIQNLLKLYA